MPERFALILGSGCADWLDGQPETVLATRYGAPSSPLYALDFHGQRVLALARHGSQASIPAHVVNYRANIAALRDSGVDAIIGLNTVGGITDLRDAGQVAVPEQLLDYTWGRQHSFYNGGEEGLEHIEFTEPFDSGLCEQLAQAAADGAVDCYAGGVYAVTQGPRLETAAEVDRLQRDGADYVGMTAMPEAALAAEAGMRYACLALVVNKAAGRGDQPIHADVAASTDRARQDAMAIIDQMFAGIARLARSA